MTPTDTITSPARLHRRVAVPMLAGFIAVCVARASGVVPSTAPQEDSFYTGIVDAASLATAVDQRLDQAQRHVSQLVASRGVETLTLFNDAQLEIETADSLSSFIARVSPDAAIRAAAMTGADRVSKYENSLALDRGVYDALAGVDERSLDGEARYFLSKTLAGYRRAGVALPEASRARVTALRSRIDSLNRQFTANIEAGTRTFRVQRSALDGLPADFLARHPANERGELELTTAAADSGPVLANARDAALRHQMFVAINNVGYPANESVLQALREARAELAGLLGYATWAAYDTADRMAGTTGRVDAFLDAVDVHTKAKASAEYDRLLAQKRLDDRSASTVEAWDADYYSERVRRDLSPTAESFTLPYATVERGVLRIAQRLFGVSFTPAHVAVWHPSVEALEMRQGDHVIGLVYLDMQVRPNKRNRGAGTVVLRSGGASQLPEVAIVAGFAGDGVNGLLTHAEIRTFFHEFGHALHFVLGGRHPWTGLDAAQMERDFLEAPSQMLETWMWDASTLRLLLGDGTSAESLGKLDRLLSAQRASQFGEALRERQLLFRSRLAWQLHGTHPTADADAVTKEAFARSLPYPPVPDTHHYASFTHLANPNYTSGYYTYLWSLAVAKDLETRFDRRDLLAQEPARRFRTMLLEPGASKPAASIVRDFLGRAFSTKAWENWLRDLP